MAELLRGLTLHTVSASGPGMGRQASPRLVPVVCRPSSEGAIPTGTQEVVHSPEPKRRDAGRPCPCSQSSPVRASLAGQGLWDAGSRHGGGWGSGSPLILQGSLMLGMLAGPRGGLRAHSRHAPLLNPQPQPTGGVPAGQWPVMCGQPGGAAIVLSLSGQLHGQGVAGSWAHPRWELAHSVFHPTTQAEHPGPWEGSLCAG